MYLIYYYVTHDYACKRYARRTSNFIFDVCNVIRHGVFKKLRMLSVIHHVIEILGSCVLTKNKHGDLNEVITVYHTKLH